MATLDQVFAFVHAGALGFFAFPIFILWSITFCLARRRKDPARVAFTWLKVAFGSEFLYVMLSAHLISSPLPPPITLKN